MHYNCMQLPPVAGIETVREWHGRVYAIRIINTAVNKMAAGDGSDIVSHKIDIRARRREGGSFSEGRPMYVRRSTRMDRPALLLVAIAKEIRSVMYSYIRVIYCM